MAVRRCQLENTFAVCDPDLVRGCKAAEEQHFHEAVLIRGKEIFSEKPHSY